MMGLPSTCCDGKKVCMDMTNDKLDVTESKHKKERYIPGRFIIAILLIIIETLSVIGIVLLCAKYIPYFYIAVVITEIWCVLRIVNSTENPDYKVPWLIFVICVPVAGFMIYLMFYNRKLDRKFIKRIKSVYSQHGKADDTKEFARLEKQDRRAYLDGKQLCRLSGSHLYQNTDAKYYELGDNMLPDMIEDLNKAEKFIFMEYFIIEEGTFWNRILEVLKEKAAVGVEVRVMYDDVGCMLTLPGDYYKTLQSYGIEAVSFSRLRGQANNEFNNRSHRKITVIDGKIGYTGGINLADEYINQVVKHGHWKDVVIRIEGQAVDELTKLFLLDYEMNVKTPIGSGKCYYESGISRVNDGYMIPFGDGPGPIYRYRVAKTAIMNMLAGAEHYVYMMTPYLIIDNELCRAIENAALRGIDVRIITPHIPDKKIVFLMTRSNYKRLMDNGVKIYEYEPGFVHAKVYLSDDKYGIVGTINMDYRSLVHHFENGVWMYNHQVLGSVKQDIEATLNKSIEVDDEMIKNTLGQRFIRAVVRVLAPLL